jgi:hypothetical protein
MIEIFVFILCLIFTLISYVLLNSVTFYRFINGKHKLKYENYIVVVTGCDTGFGNMLSLSLSKLGFFVVSLVLTKEGKCSVINNDEKFIHLFHFVLRI